MNITKSSCLDVLQYPPEFLERYEDFVRVRATYKKTWDDGFGARGWKLNPTIGDPQIIASTRETGRRINTSVFIHDILDHFLSGFGASGHRSEAMALIQLSKRTNSDPRSDYEQMVKEDIINGRVNGEKLISFLPEDLRTLLPIDREISNKEVIVYLRNVLGEAHLIESLIEHFFTLGKAGEEHARESWSKLGLDSKKQTQIGLALQDILNRVDLLAEEWEAEILEASISISNLSCALHFLDSSRAQPVFSANVA